MTTRPAVLNSVQKLVGKDTQCHPGLKLDRLSEVPESQEDSKQPLTDVVNTKGDRSCFSDVVQRHRKALEALGSVMWQRTTAGPLSLHLARAGIFENAGLCLHRTYGFAYIPGTGLKGMARAWAEISWLPKQPDRKAAQDKIDLIFGWGDTKERKELIKKDGVSAEHQEIKDQSGQIIFHDAWPVEWPELAKDILASHHTKYYQGSDDRYPPGDWEKLNMVSFLTVEPKTTFEFAVSPLRSEASGLMSLAQEWLDAALTYLGAGAKTNSGYGAFSPPKGESFSLSNSDRFASFETNLRLLSPAWYAGADQEDPKGCDLRSASLRGLLRWWWRTMYSAHLSVTNLRRLETALFGDAKHSGAIRVFVEKAKGNRSPIPSPYKDASGDADQNFCKKHGINLPHGIQTAGIVYIAYGMHEKSRGQIRRRYCIEPGASWSVRIVSRTTTFPVDAENGTEIDNETVLRQAKAALWLLVRHAGSGSKARNGFGSFATPAELTDMSLNECRKASKDLRDKLNLKDHVNPGEHETPSIDAMLDPVEVPTNWADGWYAMHQIGSALQSIASAMKHNPEKRGLGLPRKVHGPLGHALPHQDKSKWQEPKNVTSIKVRGSSDRHPAALFFSLDETENGKLLVRITAMPDKYLREKTSDYKAHREFLESVIPQLKEELIRHAGQVVKSGSPPPAKTFTLEGAQRITLDWRPDSFIPGQNNCNEESVSSLLSALGGLESSSELADTIKQYHQALGLSDKKRRKKFEKNEKLQPLIKYLMEKYQP